MGLNRRKRTTAENVKVRLHNVTYDNVTDTTELIYTVFDDEEPILAREAVANMSNVDDMEMAIMLDQVVVVKAEGKRLEFRQLILMLTIMKLY